MREECAVAEWDWTVSWWLFWRVFRVLESSVKGYVSHLLLFVGVLWYCARRWARGGGKHTFERVLRLAQAQVSGLLEGGEGFIDAGDG